MEIHSVVAVLYLCVSVLAQDGTINLGGSIMVNDPSGDPSKDTGGGGGGDGQTIEGMVLPGGTGDKTSSQQGTGNVVSSGGTGSSGGQSSGSEAGQGADAQTNTKDSTKTNTEGVTGAGSNQGETGQGSTMTGNEGVNNQGTGNRNIGSGAESIGSGQSNQGEVRSTETLDKSRVTQGGGSSFFGEEPSVFGGDGSDPFNSGPSPMIAGVTSVGGRNTGQNQDPSTRNTGGDNTGIPAFGGRSSNTGIIDSQSGSAGGGPGSNINDRRVGAGENRRGTISDRRINTGGGQGIGGARNIGGGATRSVGEGAQTNVRGRNRNDGDRRFTGETGGSRNIGGTDSIGGGRGTRMRGGTGNERVVEGGRGGGGTVRTNDRGAAAAAAAAANVIRGASRRDNERRTSRDRIVGGVGGGGFGELSVDRGACYSMCGFDTDSCERYHNCTHYENCFPFAGSSCTCILQLCPFGTLFSRISGRCDIASNVYCEDDPCDKNSGLIAYASGINCKTYYICSEEYRRRSIPMCCTDFHSYSESEERCIPDDTCGRIPCTMQSSLYDPDKYATSTPEPLQESCPLRPYRPDPTKYMIKAVPNLVRECAVGSIYDDSACTCVRTVAVGNAPIIRGCSELLTIDFGSGSLEDPRRSVPVYAEDVRYVQTEQGAEYGFFNGVSSKIKIPYFQSKPLTRFVARIRFSTPGDSGPENQVLLSYCHTANERSRGQGAPIDGESNTALSMILVKRDRKIKIEGYTLENGLTTELIELDYQPRVWNSVELIFDGKVLLARNRLLTSDKPKPQEKSIQLRGYVNGGIHPLSLGSCRGNDGYHGYIDMIKIYECIPRNQRGG